MWQTIEKWTKEEILTALSQQVDVPTTNIEDTKNEVEALKRKEVEEDKRKTISAKAKAILDSWSQLQEVKFKIPKNVRADQRAQHEREVEQASKENFETKNIEEINNHHTKPWSYFEGVQGFKHEPYMPNMVSQGKPVIRKRPRPSR